MALSGFAVRDEFKKYDNSLKDYTDVQMEQVMDAADRLSYAAGRGEVESVADEFDAQVLSLCKLQSEAEACISAIRKAAQEYAEAVPEQRKEAKLDARLEELLKEEYLNHQHFDQPKSTKHWAQWCKELGRKGPQGVEDDELEVEAGGQFKSVRCTLTQKHIFELKEPVEDAHEFIWEKEAILQYIREHPNYAQNPAVPGVPITAAELKPARRVMRAAAENHRRAATRADQIEEEIL